MNTSHISAYQKLYSALELGLNSRSSRAALMSRAAAFILARIQSSARLSLPPSVRVARGTKPSPCWARLPSTNLLAFQILLQNRRYACMTLMSKLMSPPPVT